MYRSIRPLLFRLDPEQAHGLTLGLIRLAGALPPVRAFLRRWFAAPQQPVQAFGLTFSNPVGLAAGYDKDGLGWRGLAALGFGHIEVGTITPRPQPGNPKPRIFRLPEHQAVINRMGFPSQGAELVARRFEGRPPGGPVLGANLGKNKVTPIEIAAQDYLCLMPVFAPLADYLAINISSPNTAGLRRLQARGALEDLLGQVAQERQVQAARLGRPVPVLVKLAPDLSDDELDDALDVLLRTRMDGVIATNTTLRREGVSGPRAGETGGLSGAPLRSLSAQMVCRIYERTGGKLPVIGVGGIMNAAGAREKLDAGAVLVQVYSGMVYAGPGLVQQVLKGLSIRGSQI
ncbi:MAG TPA: quinone-dependent dihydroorotate dehydrogenase [Anaerolineales bacterium]